MMQETQERKCPLILVGPVGVRFYPTEQELVGYYLYCKVHGLFRDLNEYMMIEDCDFYGEEEPWEIWDRFGGPQLDVVTVKDLYFFTALKKKSSTGARIGRSVGSSGGQWHGDDAPREMKVKVMVPGAKDQWISAKKKTFSYRNPKSDQAGNWIMHEYSLCLDGMSNNIVLCALRNGHHGSSQSQAEKRNSDHESESAQSLAEKRNSDHESAQSQTKRRKT